MKNNKNKTALKITAAVVASFTLGGFAALGSGTLNWGGEEDIQKIETIIDSMKNEVFGRDKTIADTKSEAEGLIKEISELKINLEKANASKEELEKQIAFLSDEVVKGDIKLKEKDEYYNGVIADTDKFYGDEIFRMSNEITKLQSDKHDLELNIFNMNGEKLTAESKYNEVINDLEESDQKLQKAKLDVNELLIKAENTLEEVSHSDESTK